MNDAAVALAWASEMPTWRRRPGPLGAGASPGTVAPCQTFVLTVRKSQGKWPALPAQLSVGLLGPANAVGNMFGAGANTSGFAVALPGGYSDYDIVAVTPTGTLPSCAPGKVVFHAPAGQVGQGGYQLSQVPLPVAFPISGKWDAGVQGDPAAAGTPFVMQQGHRIQSTTTTGGVLPLAFQGQSMASLQKQVDQAGIQSKIVSVLYDHPTSPTKLTVIEDHCGPTSTTSSPYQVTDGGVTVTTTYLDMGLGSCPPVASSGSGKKTALIVGGAVLSVVVIGGVAYWAWG